MINRIVLDYLQLESVDDAAHSAGAFLTRGIGGPARGRDGDDDSKPSRAGPERVW